MGRVRGGGCSSPQQDPQPVRWAVLSLAIEVPACYPVLHLPRKVLCMQYLNDILIVDRSPDNLKENTALRAKDLGNMAGHVPKSGPSPTPHIAGLGNLLMALVSQCIPRSRCPDGDALGSPSRNKFNVQWVCRPLPHQPGMNIRGWGGAPPPPPAPTPPMTK